MRLTLAAAVLVFALPASAQGAWKPLETEGRAPGARFDHGLAATGARSVYLFGGQRSGRALGDLWRLDLRRRRWTRLRPGGARPSARFGHNLLAEPGGTLLLLGGQSGSRFFSEAWRYAPSRNRWTRLAAGAGPAARYGAGAAIQPGSKTAWMTHGFTTEGRFDDTWSLSRDRFADLSAPGARPLRRCLVQSAFADGGLFLFGGQSDPVPFRDDLWRYDAGRRDWEELRPARRPSRRNRYAAAQTSTAWFIHGGDGPRGPRGDLWRYDFAAGSFERVAMRGPRARGGHALAAAGRTLVLFGGTNGDGELADAWIYPNVNA